MCCALKTSVTDTYVLVEGRKGIVVVEEVLRLCRGDHIAEGVGTCGRHVAVQLSWRGRVGWRRWRSHWLLQPKTRGETSCQYFHPSLPAIVRLNKREGDGIQIKIGHVLGQRIVSFSGRNHCIEPHRCILHVSLQFSVVSYSGGCLQRFGQSFVSK